MKLIIFLVLILNISMSRAEVNVNDLPADVQSEINQISPIPTVSKTDKKPETVVINDKTEKISVPTTSLSFKAENEIPLNLEVQKKVTSTEPSIFKFLTVFSILGILLVGTWFGLKKYKTKNVSKNHNEIKILAQHFLGPKKSLAVVRVAGESLLVGITDNQINLIKSLALLDDEIPEVSPDDFKKTFNNNLNQSQQQNSNEIEYSELINDEYSSSQQENESKYNDTYNRKATVKNNSSHKSKVKSNEEIDEFSIRGVKDIVSSKLKGMRSI